MSVETAIDNMDNSNNAHRWALHDVSLSRTLPALSRGPALFQPLDLLDASAGSDETHDHRVCHLLVGTKDSYTQSHEDFFGFDGMLYLVEGRKVWVCGPPEQAAMFEQLIGNSSLPVTKRPKRMDTFLNGRTG
jgi:hypothetical protein